MLYPDYVAQVNQLPLDELRRRGVTALAFDVDHTLAHRRSRQLAPELAAYLAQLRRAGFTLFIASNALTDLSVLSAEMQAVVVPARLLIRKPMRRYYRRVIRAADCAPGAVAMIGDRVVNDIVGANRAGLVTVLVDPLGRRKLWLRRAYDRWLSR